MGVALCSGENWQLQLSWPRAVQVRHMLAERGRLKQVRQVIVNPSDEALWNLMSACSNTGAPAICTDRHR